MTFSRAYLFLLVAFCMYCSSFGTGRGGNVWASHIQFCQRTDHDKMCIIMCKIIKLPPYGTEQEAD